MSPPPRPRLRRLAPVPYIEADDPRLDDFRALDLDVGEIQAWANIPDTLFRRNRIQLLSSFPVLIPLLTDTNLSERSIVMELGALVDRGDRLVEALARIFGVGMSVVRHFCGRPAAEVGREWLGNPYEVMLAIETAPTDKRPHSREEWSILKRYWGYANLDIPPNRYHAETWRHSFMNEYLFASMCRLGYKNASLNRLNRITRNRPECIGQAVDYFGFVHNWCALTWGRGTEELQEESHSPSLAESLLMRYPLRELIRQSLSWHQEMTQLIPAHREFDGPNGESIVNTWPGLLRLPYSFGGLTAVSLVCADDLTLEGCRLLHCVGTYVEPCLKGESHIVSIRDPGGESLSTAEIELKREDKRWISHVIQHQGMNNSYPSQECHDILDRLVKSLEESATQRWISELQTIHENRREQIGMYLLEAQEDHARLAQTIMPKVLPDFATAYDWLEDMADAGMQ